MKPWSKTHLQLLNYCIFNVLSREVGRSSEKQTNKKSSAGFLKLAADKRCWQPGFNVACQWKGGSEQQRREQATWGYTRTMLKAGFQVFAGLLNNSTSHGTHHVVGTPCLPL